MTNLAQKPAAHVALVIGQSEEARDVALFTAARGVPVVLVGAIERTIAERVGEIVFGGGKARHVAGDPEAGATIDGALAKASSSFGAATIAFVDGAIAEACGHELSARAPGLRVVVLTGSADSSIFVSKVFET